LAITTLNVSRSSQAGCLFDDSGTSGYMDHKQLGRLPGERFDAHEQCLLKYGRGSVHATSQDLSEVCRDLHCQRERYTWTSHPALEGTLCGANKVSFYVLNTVSTTLARYRLIINNKNLKNIKIIFFKFIVIEFTRL